MATLIFLFIFSSAFVTSAQKPKLLIQIFSNSECENSPELIKKYKANLSNISTTSIHLFCDVDALWQKKPEIKNQLEKIKGVALINLNAKSIPELSNEDAAKTAFDFLVVVSDNFEPAVKNFDQKLIKEMNSRFADGDGVINTVQEGLEQVNIIPIMGKKYYERLGYVYFPKYKISHFDQELTSVSRILAKEAIISTPLFKNIEGRKIQLQIDPSDQRTFIERRKNNFDLSQDQLNMLIPKEWSILICTLEERKESFDRIHNKLFNQIKELGLEDKIEVITFKDNRENSVGFKRNWLLDQSRGMYVNYIDDDDDVHDQYIKIIHNKLQSKPDCVSLVGIITFNGSNPLIFIHSVKYNSYFQKDDIFYRPPNHINTIKRSAAVQFRFPTISFGEDTNWAMRIAYTGLLKNEEAITEPYYFYKYVSNK